jgi:ADP-ribose pyrophosphatase YjhB (NUDIX family)
MATRDGPVPFSKVKIRTGALVFCDEDVALIRRDRLAGTHYTTPGGNVETGEDLLGALGRELAEELRLDLADTSPPELCWIQDQMVTRPGPEPSPRKLHLTFRCFITSGTRAKLATTEYDEQPGGGHEPGIIDWISYRKAAEIPLFLLIGHALARLPSPGAPVVGSPLLKPVTDASYMWI